MKSTYTSDELLAHARLLMGFDHVRSDCGVTQTDGIDVNSLISDSLRQWHLNLLDHGDVRLLSPESCTFTAASSPGKVSGTILKPNENCRRLLSVRLAGWHHAVEILPTTKMEQIIRDQLNPYTAATTSHPVAVAAETSNSVYCWPQASEYGSSEITGICDHGPDIFTLDDSALSTLPSWLEKLKITDYGNF